MKDKSFEIIPGVKVLEAKFYSINGKRLNISKYKQFNRKLNGKNICEQAFRDKLAKHFGYVVCKSWNDGKQFVFEVMVNNNKTELKTVSYDVAAKCFGWKGIKFSKTCQHIIPVK